MGMRLSVKVSGTGQGAVWTTEATRETLGFLLARIVQRTRGGVSASGAAFMPYKSPGYGDTAAPDLHDTGATLGSIAPIKVTMSGGRLAMTNRAAYSVIQNRLHPYMGVLDSEVDAALAHVERVLGSDLPRVPTKMAAKLRSRSAARFAGDGEAVRERGAIRRELKRQAKLAARREYDRARRAERRVARG